MRLILARFASFPRTGPKNHELSSRESSRPTPSRFSRSLRPRTDRNAASCVSSSSEQRLIIPAIEVTGRGSRNWRRWGTIKANPPTYKKRNASRTPKTGMLGYIRTVLSGAVKAIRSPPPKIGMKINNVASRDTPATLQCPFTNALHVACRGRQAA